MESWSVFIQQFGRITDDDISLMNEKAKIVSLSKGNYFSEAGRVPTRVCFVLEGVLRGVYYTSDGLPVTRCFIPEGNLAVDYMNFERASPSTEYLAACTDCTLLIFSKSDWLAFSDLIANWDTAKNKMVQSCMHLKSRKGPVISQNATNRYLEFMQNYPGLINRVSLADIASYLGITLPSLSRIRKNIR
ncbi:Crp/Fnr family transcriptional regulator [Sphingobacterium sp. lm-10]|uniref:Crp/Fnr family transcriptional regulator n=1 Tax=Sphingobacterium sp. lm-10 TaxID=2944904 RepID=UPI00202163AA|nr:Crp/Fnr family transcriptional regulator [Sphingobacterium sp. lm-10]MCL7987249.1 Crp/Fnr family transcriptional regulator [Sphingobacterium sp. lm-10]